MGHTGVAMAKVASFLVVMVLLASIVEGRDWRFETSKRVKRGYNPGHFGSSNDGTNYGRSNENNASGSRERLGCNGEQGGGGYGSGSHELQGPYDRDGTPNYDRRHRSFSKATASASASAVAYKQDQKTNAAN